MILTVTPNPTIDRVLFVRNFAMQDVVRAEQEVISPSGKGIDVSLILHTMGQATHAIALQAGRHGALLAELVAEQGLAVDWIPAQGETRMATLLTDRAQGRQSTILAHTLHAQPEQLNRILARMDAHMGWAWGLVSAGSLPPGLPLDTHAQVIARAVQQGLFTLLDSSGPGLAAGVEARPHVLKVNAAEFAGLVAESHQPQLNLADIHPTATHPTGLPPAEKYPGEEPQDAIRSDCTHQNGHPRPCTGGENIENEKAVGRKTGDRKPGDGKVTQGGAFGPDFGLDFDDRREDKGRENHRFEKEGIETVLRLAEQIKPYVGEWAREAIIVTLGRQGILAVTNQGTYHAPGLAVPVVSPAGAGDAVAAGIMLGRRRGEDWPAALIWASALAATVVGHAGTAECTRQEVLAHAEKATVIELDAAG